MFLGFGVANVFWAVALRRSFLDLDVFTDRPQHNFTIDSSFQRKHKYAHMVAAGIHQS